MIDGLQVIKLDVHSDQRGWFKENWRRGWLDFRPVQQNVSFNKQAGTTRGLHAEPWNKLVSVGSGKALGAWIDLRESSPTYGHTYTHELSPEVAVFVPRGVANGFQTLVDDTTYLYLVDDHWSPQAKYTSVSYRIIDWPLTPTQVSEKDEKHPAELTPVSPKKILVTGADGQLGRALRKLLDGRADFYTRAKFDVTNPPALNWRDYYAIINAAAYNDVDGAESDRGAAWAVNAEGPATLARIATENDLTLVHVSSDYVFDGKENSYDESSPVAPLNFYGATKAAGEQAVRQIARHYIVRTQWVYGDGQNFVDVMKKLADEDKNVRVVHDQVGRVTSAEDLARGIVHLLNTRAEYGVYNLTGTGDAVSRDEIAMAIFIARGQDPANVTPVSSAEFYGDRPHARRPNRTVLDTSKIEATGFSPTNWRVGLALYLA